MLTRIDKSLTLQHLVACFLTICCHFIHYVIVVSEGRAGMGNRQKRCESSRSCWECSIWRRANREIVNDTNRQIQLLPLGKHPIVIEYSSGWWHKKWFSWRYDWKCYVTTGGKKTCGGNSHGKCWQIQYNKYYNPAHPRAQWRLRALSKKTG